ncbi:MAG: gfo/Idh/MocA family oxidoreductase [Alphaproteobacteria bacterium]|nr:gfo/Idh/MocA family oxidoreductase [Alphaproteobacteria bacterium]
MLRIGLLGAARITPRSVIAPARASGAAEIVAVASRDIDRARTYAAEHAIAHALGSYESLIAREDLDLIYNALPPSGHAPWSIAALRAGKHVLCEKPLCLNAREAEAMRDAARASGKRLISGYHYRHHAMMKRLANLIDNGAIGAVRAVGGVFKVPVRRTPDELRMRAELGGGAMMDLGSYVLDAMRLLLKSEPQIVSAQAQMYGDVDVLMCAHLRFGKVEARIKTAMRAGPPVAFLHVRGETGSVRARNFIAPQLGNAVAWRGRGDWIVEHMDGPTTFDAQMAHVLDVVAGRADPNPSLDDNVLQMRACDAIYAAA